MGFSDQVIESVPPEDRTENPLFTTITPTHNRSTLLAPTLDTIARQTETDFETIVIDDGSTDNTADVAEAHLLKPRVLRQANAGPAAARNTGLAQARGTYIAFLDSDDLWMPWTLAVYREAIERHNQPAFIAGRPHRFRRESDLEAIKQQPLETRAFADYLASGDQWRWFGVSSFVIRRDILKAAGGFHSARANGEDADLALRLGTTPGFVQITAPATFGYREHEGNITGNVELSLLGIRRMLKAEHSGHYPGGPARKRERRRIITRHVRPHSLACLKAGRWHDAWQLYRQTIGWSLQQRRFRYLLGFPILAAVHAANTLWPERQSPNPKRQEIARRTES